MRVRFLKWCGDPAATSDVGICRHEGRMRESVKPLCCPILPTLAPIVGASVQAAYSVCSPPHETGPARVSRLSAQVGQARLVVGRGWGWGSQQGHDDMSAQDAANVIVCLVYWNTDGTFSAQQPRPPPLAPPQPAAGLPAS